MAERHQWTEEDLQALREAVATLERLGVWTVYVRGAGRPDTEVFMSSRDLAQIARLPGVAVERPEYRAPNWMVSARAGDMAFSALMDAQELLTIGWRYVGPADYLEEVTPVDSAHAS